MLIRAALSGPASRTFRAGNREAPTASRSTTRPLAVTGAQNVAIPPEAYPNTTFTDGITDTFTVGTARVNGRYPIYVSWEDDASGFDNIMLSGSFDGGLSWTPPVRVNDNTSPADEFQPNLAAAAN